VGIFVNLAKSVRATNKRLFYLLLFILVDAVLVNSWQFIPPVERYNFVLSVEYLRVVIRTVIIFYLIPYNWIFLKASVLVYLFTEIMDVILRAIKLYYRYFDIENLDWISGLLIYISWIYFLIPFIWLAYIYKHFADKPSDDYSPDCAYIVVHKPVIWHGTLYALFGQPAQGIGILVNGNYYLFRSMRTPYTKTKFYPTLNQNRLIKIPVPSTKKLQKFMDSKTGLPHRLIKQNCITILDGIPMPIQTNGLNFIPAFFLSNLEKKNE